MPMRFNGQNQPGYRPLRPSDWLKRAAASITQQVMCDRLFQDQESRMARKQFGQKTKGTRVSPGKRSGANTASVADWAKLIKSAWHKSVRDILEVGHLCAQADDQLGKSERSALIKELGFSKSTFSKLVKNGKDPRLQSIIKHLPASYTTIYEIAMLDDKTLNDAVEDGIIHPGSQREEIEELREKGEGTGKKPKPKQFQKQGKDGDQENESDDQENDNDGQKDSDADQEDDKDDQESAGADEWDANEEQQEDSPDVDEEFKVLNTRWKNHVKAQWAKTSKKARDRFVDEVLGYPKRITRKRD
jgi:hypothetical protein